LPYWKVKSDVKENWRLKTQTAENMKLSGQLSAFAMRKVVVVVLFFQLSIASPIYYLKLLCLFFVSFLYLFSFYLLKTVLFEIAVV